MSLDVWLETDTTHVQHPKIYVRENGQVREISREEWDEKFPGTEPIVVDEHENMSVYWDNITHNLGKMAREAEIYSYLWRPDELGIEKADQLIVPLRNGLALLKSDPARFVRFNPENGWGDYEGLVAFVENYLSACEMYPEASIKVSR